jgi:hypothetical protein
MKKTAWRDFKAAKDHYREIIEKLRDELPDLGALQQKLVNQRPGLSYKVETPIVYNEALNSLGPKDEIRLILAADNPGRREQAAENRRYLVGPSGKLAEKFFREVLDIDFRKNVLILNKTPIHTPRTVELRELGRLGGTAVVEAVITSQKAMAALLLEFHRCLAPVPVWIIGYSEMKQKGIFEAYTETLRTLYAPQSARKKELFLYRHFSMNQFTIDLRRQAAPEEEPGKTLARIGLAYRERILGW